MKATKWVHDWHDGSRPREEILQMNNRASYERQFNRACQRRDSSQTISTKEEAKPPKSYGDVPGCHWYVLKCTNIEIADVNAILEILTTFPLQNNKILLLLPTSFWELVWGVIKTHTADFEAGRSPSDSKHSSEKCQDKAQQKDRGGRYFHIILLSFISLVYPWILKK